MTSQLRPVEEVASHAISAVGWTDTETATKHAVSILITDRDTAYTLLRDSILGQKHITGDCGKCNNCETHVSICEQVLEVIEHNKTLDEILTLLDHIYGKTDALTK